MFNTTQLLQSIELLHSHAPLVFVEYAAKKTTELSAQLANLREQWKTAEIGERLFIEKDAKTIKEQLDLIQTLTRKQTITSSVTTYPPVASPPSAGLPDEVSNDGRS